MTDLEKEMLEALRPVGRMADSLMKEIRNEGPADWGLINNTLVEVTRVIAKAEGRV